MLAQLLTGESLRAVSERRLRKLRIPRELIGILMKLLSPRRELRFETTDEVVRAFAALRSHSDGIAAMDS